MKALAAVLAALVSTSAFSQEVTAPAPDAVPAAASDAAPAVPAPAPVARAPMPTPVRVPPKESPFIGKWKTTYTKEECVETQEYTEKGVKITQSGEAVTEDFYTLFKLGDSGFYKISGYVSKENGKADCAGQLVSVGSTSTIFIKFNPDGSYTSCSSMDETSCYADSVRTTPKPN